MSNFYWLCWEPFVYSSKKNEQILFYNTLNGKIIELDNCNIFDSYNQDNNSIMINARDYNDSRIKELIRNFEKYNIGQIIKSSDAGGQPFTPKFILKNDLIKSFNESLVFGGDRYKEFLFELTLFLQSPSENGNDKYSAASQQYSFLPLIDGGKKVSIDIKEILKVLDNEGFYSLRKVNVSGGNLFSYNKITELASYFRRRDLLVEYYISLTDFIERIDIVSSLDLGNSTCNIYLFNKEIYNLKENINKLTNLSIKHCFYFLISSQDEFDDVEQFISDYDNLNVKLLPFFYNDIEFLRKNVFIRREDISENIVGFSTIIKNSLINRLNFGKLIIREDGEIYSSSNSGSLGNIAESSLSSVIGKEFSSKKSWFKTRNDSQPCSNCNFASLCPPISGIEEYYGKNDNCCIYNKTMEIIYYT